jgi:peptide deformylase
MFMAIRPIVYWPNPCLFEVASEVTESEIGSEGIKSLVQDLVDTCAYGRGVGICAPQIGVPKRVILIPGSDNSPLILLNPVVCSPSEDLIENTEGCLSFPGVLVKVSRPREVEVRALTLEGTAFSTRISGIEAVAVQHECDHLNGITLSHYAGDTQRNLFKGKIDKQLRTAKRIIERRTQEVEALKSSIRDEMTFSVIRT